MDSQKGFTFSLSEWLGVWLSVVVVGVVLELLHYLLTDSTILRKDTYYLSSSKPRLDRKHGHLR